MMYIIRQLVSIVLIVLTSIQLGSAETIVSENFDDKAFSNPLTYYNVDSYDQNLAWDAENAYGGTGYCLRFDHALSYSGLGILTNFAQNVGSGVYIRYYVKYDAQYTFPAEQGDFDNLKLFKLASGGGLSDYDVEFIYKSTDNGGPSRLQLYWFDSAGDYAGTKTGSVPLPNTMGKGIWHKIEIYIKINSSSTVHVQIDDAEIYHVTDADIKLPGSVYTGAQQFMSIRAGSRTDSGHGYWYTDNVTIIANEGDLCNNEPSEPFQAGTTPDNYPTVTIQSPTTQASLSVDQSELAVSGIASDDFGIQSVSWSLNNGQSNSITGDLGNWSTGVMNLQEGTNQIVVLVTDNNNQTSSDTLTVTYMPGDNTLTWSAVDQTGDSSWSDSSATWCVRALVEGASIVNQGGQVILGFQGRNSGAYSVRKVSIAERDPNGSEGDVVNSTWTRITFDGNDVATWDTDSTTISAGAEKLSDAVPFTIEPNKDYYVTFVLEAPSAYLEAPSYYSELYFDGTDHASDVDWSSTGFSSYASRLHALSSIYVLEGDGGGSVIALPGIPGDASIVIN